MLVSTSVPCKSEPSILEDLRGELGFEETLSELSTTFINLPVENIDAEIEYALKRVVELFGTDRATLAEIDADSGSLTVTHRCCRPGIPSGPSTMMSHTLPWLYERIMSGVVTQVSRAEELPAAAIIESAFMKKVGVKSAIVMPFSVGGALVGCLSTSAFDHYLTWSPGLVLRIREVANVLAHALGRKRDDERLRAAYAQISALKEQLQHERVYLREEVKLEHSHSAVTGQSEGIRTVLKRAEQVALTDSAVLIIGETGTGKELIARTIHDLSKRRDKQMVKVNCAAMPATLIESELFGREKGAYTGALSREIGRFELADHSTIFLDEIGELPLELQSKLLRVLQDGEFQRLGSPRTHRVNARVITATNRDLRGAIKEGKFREDLFYRLSVFPIELPPLRERREDILDLTWHHLKDLCARMGRQVEGIHPATLRSFQAYSWPGNIRELRNVIERYLILNPGPVFRAEIPESEHGNSAELNLDEVERRHVQQVLQGTRWRIRGKGGAAEILGVKPTTLEARMKRLGIVRPQ